jgi:hypothetical protein
VVPPQESCSRAALRSRVARLSTKVPYLARPAARTAYGLLNNYEGPPSVTTHSASSFVSTTSHRAEPLSLFGGTTTVGELGEASGASVCCRDLLVAGGSANYKCHPLTTWARDPNATR